MDQGDQGGVSTSRQGSVVSAGGATLVASDLVPIGRSSIAVSRLGLGTAPLGALPPDAEEEALGIVRHALSAGIRFIDSAPLYGFGRAESRIGEVIAAIDRSELVLSTKVGRALRPVSFAGKVTDVLGESVRHPRNGVRRIAASASSLSQRALGRHAEGGVGSLRPAVAQDISYDGALRSVDQSLTRLKTDHLDILFIHEPEGPMGPVMDGAYRALDRLRSEGSVAAIGVGTNDPDVLEAYARAGDLDCLLLGYGYTLLDQRAERSLLPYALERGIAVIVGGPFNSGILTDENKGTFNNDAATRDQRARAAALAAIAGRHGVTLKAAALRFPYRHTAVASVLVGVRAVSELEENIAMMSAAVPDALWEECFEQGLLPDPAHVA